MAVTRTESVERALSILMAFTAQRPTMSLAELADETGLHKSTILRLANSLGIYGFIQRDDGGRFSIGPSVWRLGLLFRRDFVTREAIAPAGCSRDRPADVWLLGAILDAVPCAPTAVQSHASCDR